MRYQYGKSNPRLRPGARVIVCPDTGEVRRVVAPERAERMAAPVRCRCGHVYDLAAVTVTARYADCSAWTTPCCKRQVDDRPPWIGQQPAFERLAPDGAW